MKAVRLAPPSLTISVRIFITSLSTAEPELSDPALSSAVEKTNTSEHPVTRRDSFSSSLSPLPGAKMEHGRPNLDVLLKEEISGASGRMSVSGKYLGSQFPRMRMLLTGQQFAGRRAYHAQSVAPFASLSLGLLLSSVEGPV